MDPLVSVVVPAYNSGSYLAATIESVLAQEHRPLELIVVDDGSTDGTPETLARWGGAVTLIRQPRRGHPAARNTGIRAARGEFLGFIDHDDLRTTGSLARQLERFHRNPELDLVFGHIQNFFSDELTVEERAQLKVPLVPLPGLLQGAMLARRASFDRVGPFAEDRTIGDFIDWYGRATMAGLRTDMLPDVVLRRRIHRSNHQRQYRAEVHQGYLKAVKELLDRRRAAGVRETGS